MSLGSARIAERAAELRREFDGGFARPAEGDPVDRTELLAIRIGSDPHAVRLSEVAGLHVDRRVARVPGPLPELLGLVSLRGILVPIYDLRLLLGYAGGGPAPRWVLVAAAQPVGLAFDALDGHMTVAAGRIVAEPAAPPQRPVGREVVEGPTGARSILLHVPSLVNDIAARARRARKER